jgi:putative membrane protein
MLWVVALHVIFVVTLFAAVFYLPRLFVYHALCTEPSQSEQYKIMERRLFRGILVPSAVLVGLSGFWLLYGFGWAQQPHIMWLHIKLILVLGLYIYMGVCWKYLHDFKHDKNKHSHVFYRWFNEIPSVLLIIIVILAIVKPF